MSEKPLVAEIEDDPSSPCAPCPDGAAPAANTTSKGAKCACTTNFVDTSLYGMPKPPAGTCLSCLAASAGQMGNLSGAFVVLEKGAVCPGVSAGGRMFTKRGFWRLHPPQ